MVIGWVFLVIAAPVFVSSIPPYPRTGLGLLLLLSFGVGETFLLYLSFLLVSFFLTWKLLVGRCLSQSAGSFEDFSPSGSGALKNEMK